MIRLTVAVVAALLRCIAWLATLYFVVGVAHLVWTTPSDVTDRRPFFTSTWGVLAATVDFQLFHDSSSAALRLRTLDPNCRMELTNSVNDKIKACGKPCVTQLITGCARKSR